VLAPGSVHHHLATRTTDEVQVVSVQPNYASEVALIDTRLVDQHEPVTSRVSDEHDGGRTTLPPRHSTWERAIPWVIALVFASLYATISVARFQRLGTQSFDLGIFEQAIRHYAYLQAPIVDLEGAGHNFLGDHWNPAIAVFAPFYRLFPTPITLLVGQAVLIALAVVPVTRAGMRHLGRWSGVAVGLAFGMSYGIQAAVDFDVHEVCLAVPLLAFALEALLASRWTAVAAWSAPLVLVKEDLGLTVAALGLVLVLIGARRRGFGLTAFGLASFALTMTVLIPHFNAEGHPSWARLETQPAAGNLLQRALALTIDVVMPGPRATTVLLLLVVTAFLGLRSPLMIMVLPTLAWRFISTNQNFWGQSFHYDLVLMPIVFAALIDGVVRARRDSWQPLPGYVRAAPTLALLVGLILCTRFPFRGLVIPAAYQPNPHAPAAERILSKIPDGATVETDLRLLAQLTSRTRVFFVGNAAPVVPQFVLISDQDESQVLDPVKYPDPVMKYRDPVMYAESLHPGTTYALVQVEDGYALVRRVL
jgi:uncharacterized membrane protein